MNYKLAVSIVLLIFCQFSQAAEQSINTKIDRIITYQAGHFYLTLRDDSPSCTNTNDPKRYRVSVSGVTTEDGLKLLYSTSMLAAAQGLNASIFFDDSDAECHVTRILVDFR